MRHRDIEKLFATSALALVLGVTGEARAATLCFDDPREVIGTRGGSCCLGAVIDSATSAACGARTYSCVLEARCELAVRGDSSVRIVDDTTARPVPSMALLWAGHRCCEEGTLAVRSAEEVTAFAPHPLECRLVPGYRVELELASKYGRDDTPDFGAEAPFPAEAWEMFVACAGYGPLDVAQCMNEWRIPACAAPICARERRDELVGWLEKVVSRLPRPDLSGVFPVGPGGAGFGDATLFTSRQATCCVRGKRQRGTAQRRSRSRRGSKGCPRGCGGGRSGPARYDHVACVSIPHTVRETHGDVRGTLSAGPYFVGGASQTRRACRSGSRAWSRRATSARSS